MSHPLHASIYRVVSMQLYQRIQKGGRDKEGKRVNFMTKIKNLVLIKSTR